MHLDALFLAEFITPYIITDSGPIISAVDKDLIERAANQHKTKNLSQLFPTQRPNFWNPLLGEEICIEGT